MAQEAISTDPGRTLIQSLLQPVLTHLAVGDGAVATPVKTATGLVHELGRARSVERHFVVEDPAGPIQAVAVPGGTTSRYRISPTPTNLVYLRFRFLDAEAVGTWNEVGLCGGGVVFNQRGASVLDGSAGGDDRANSEVLLGGSYVGPSNQTLTVTVSTGGGSGTARVGWTSTGAEPPASNVLVTFNTPVVLGGTGLTLTCTGGVDGVLTLGVVWKVRCLKGSETADFAASGVYDAVANEAGQVAANGSLVRLWRETPATVKGATTVDVQVVVALLNAA